jgi:2-oxoglutarate dehydrogenase E2 component (dihydrolipoamide succinyltransferase)
MAVDVKMPNVGESVQSGVIHKWKFKTGDYVERDAILLEIETDKATVEVAAEASGSIEIMRKEGETVNVGELLAKLHTDAKQPAAKEASDKPKESDKPKDQPKSEEKSAKPAAKDSKSSEDLSPAVRRMVDEHSLDSKSIEGTGRSGRVTKEDVVNHMAKPSDSKSPPAAKTSGTSGTTERREWREPMSLIRKRTAERLVYAKQTAAILTTFNEIDMSAVMNLRAQYKDQFKEKYGVSLGFMSFFTKAAVEALKAFPQVNAWIDGTDMVMHSYYDIGVAVSTPKGLVVPVVRDIDQMSMSEIELKIGEYAKKARDNKIAVDDLTGGTFTISNGGVFGSLMSTPILNPPQSAILGMHKIEERPIVVKGQIVIRPMMYVALSYDHRVIDGRESVGFLVKIKECIEDPTRLLLGV